MSYLLVAGLVAFAIIITMAVVAWRRPDKIDQAQEKVAEAKSWSTEATEKLEGVFGKKSDQ